MFWLLFYREKILGKNSWYPQLNYEDDIAQNENEEM